MLILSSQKSAKEPYLRRRTSISLLEIKYQSKHISGGEWKLKSTITLTQPPTSFLLKKKKQKPRLGNELNIKKRLQKGLEKRLKCRYITLIPHGFKIPVAHLWLAASMVCQSPQQKIDVRSPHTLIPFIIRLTTSENAGDEKKRTTAGCQGQSDHQELLSTSGVKEKDVVLIIESPNPEMLLKPLRL